MLPERKLVCAGVKTLQPYANIRRRQYTFLYENVNDKELIDTIL